jgi:hypothetical protein
LRCFCVRIADENKLGVSQPRLVTKAVLICAIMNELIVAREAALPGNTGPAHESQFTVGEGLAARDVRLI